MWAWNRKCENSEGTVPLDLRFLSIFRITAASHNRKQHGFQRFVLSCTISVVVYSILTYFCLTATTTCGNCGDFCRLYKSTKIQKLLCMPCIERSEQDLEICDGCNTYGEGLYDSGKCSKCHKIGVQCTNCEDIVSSCSVYRHIRTDDNLCLECVDGYSPCRNCKKWSDEDPLFATDKCRNCGAGVECVECGEEFKLSELYTYYFNGTEQMCKECVEDEGFVLCSVCMNYGGDIMDSNGCSVCGTTF